MALPPERPNPATVAQRLRAATDGRSVLVAQVVARGPWNPAALQEALRRDSDVAEVVVDAVDHLPLDTEGRIDFAALNSLPLADDTACRAAELAAAALPGVQAAAVVGLVAADPPKPLHLAALLPGWQRPPLTMPTTGAEAAAGITAASDAPPALADGGPLDAAADAPWTLPAVLATAAAQRSGAGLVCIDADGTESTRSYAELLAAAERVAGGLQAAGLKPGDHVLLHVRHTREFFDAFWGCLVAGVVPVPTPVAVSYTDLGANVRRLGEAHEMLGGAPVIAGSGAGAEVAQALARLGAAAPRVLEADALVAAPPGTPVAIDRDAIALMMLTSGSTGRPKGVPLRHRNLVARGIGSVRVNGLGLGTVSVNWMPLDHVGGLVLMHLRDVGAACLQVHAATEIVGGDPLVWLDLMSRFRATATFAPNFAYGLVCGQAERMAGRDWDLSTLQMMTNGGEAVVAATARRFLALLAPFGLRPSAVVPAWGMSEISSGVTYWQGLRPDTVADTDPCVPVGPPLPGVQLRIVDDAGRLLREGQVGALQVAGETVFPGYHGNRPPREETFTPDGWFRTGDLARIDGGVLTITGREKDVIIVNGANYPGAAIEAAVEETGLVERSFTAACAVGDPRASGGEGLAIFFVPAADDDAALAEALRAVRERTLADFGLVPAVRVPLRREDIPKTSLGKIQRRALQLALAEGRFEAQLRRVDVLTASEHTLPSWFLRRHWRPRPLEGADTAAARPLVLLGDGGTWAEALAAALSRHGAAPRAAFGNDLAAAFTAHAPAADAACDVVVIDTAAATTASPAARAAAAGARTAALVAALGRRRAPVTLSWLAAGGEPVVDGDPADPARAALTGLLLSAAREQAALRVRCIDIGATPGAAEAAAVAAEIAASSAAEELALRHGRRFVPVLRPWTPAPVAGAPAVLKHGGRYVVSGGAGGAGRALVQWLVRQWQARVLVLGRQASTSLPPGCDAAAADVADAQALAQATAAWCAAGPLDGVFHLAAVVEECAVADETEATLHARLAAKLDGAAHLRELARGHGAPLVLFSSIVGLGGGAQFGAYAASSRALDAMAGGDDDVRSIAWSAWRGTGLNLRYGAAEPLRAMGGLEIAPEQGLASLQALLAAPPGACFVGLDPQAPPIAARRDDALAPRALQVAVEGRPQAAAPVVADAFGTPLPLLLQPLHALPRGADGQVDHDALARLVDRRQAFNAPSRPTEIEVAALWRRVLGVDAVAADASFFDLGGQSLLATQLLNAIAQRFGVRWTLRDVFTYTTVAQQAERIDAARAAAPAPAAAAQPVAAAPAAARVLPIGSGQQRLWFIDRLLPHNPAYHVTCSVTFAEPPALAVLQGIVDMLVARHESLRTRLPLVEGEPAQHIAATLAVPVVEGTVGSEVELAAAEEAEVRAPFDLAAGPLLRARLWRLPDGRARLQLAMHHAIADGWSLQVLFGEIQALLQGETLPPPSAQYADFAQWQRQRAEAGADAPQAAFWRRQLSGNLDGMLPPADLPRRGVPSRRGGRCVVALPAALSQRVRHLARERGVTPFVTLLAAFKALMAWTTQQGDIVVGSVVANRNDARFASLVGFAVNMLTLRTDLSGNPRFADALQRVQRVLLDAHAHQEIPFEALVDQLQPPRDPGRAPLFQVAFDMRDPAITRSRLPGVELAVMRPDLGACQYDLHLTFDDTEDGFVGFWMYDAELLRPDSVARLAANFQALLEGAVADPETRLAALPLPAAAERAQLDAWNDTARTYPRERTVHALFAEQAAHAPDAVAVEHGAQRLTYRELEQRANQLAHTLRGLGVGPEVPVGLALPRTPALVVALVAILKAGGAYVPLDPEYPAERLAFMIRDAGLPVVLSDAILAPRLPAFDGRLVLVDDELSDPAAFSNHTQPPADAARADHLAYVIYTSGSTGVPKGVEVLHRSINRLVFNTDYVRFEAGDRIAQVSVVSFDAATFEFWGALLHGGTLVICDRETTLAPAALARFLAEQRIDTMFLTAALFDRVARDVPHAFGGMKYMVYGGAAASVDALRAVLGSAAPPAHLVNGYGPTEVTTFAVTHHVREVEPGASSVPIGRPIANTTAHVLGRHGERLPIGIAGELALGGDGVARGYRHRPELTAERFVPDPFAAEPGARLYRTGDVVRRRPDGLIDYLGRNDHQVKLRGFRIELGEIEAALCDADEVAEAVVTVRAAADGDRTLAAYVTPRAGATPRPDALRRGLAATLPAYMVPADIVVLAALPLSPNGKVDRARLPDPASVNAAAPAAAQLPQGELERVIADVWRQVLGRPQVDRRISFFDAGGHSLKLAQMHGLLAAKLGREIPIVDLFRHPTIASLAGHLAKRADTADANKP